MSEQFDEMLARRRVLELELEIVYALVALNRAGMKRVAEHWARLNGDRTWPLTIVFEEPEKK